MTFIHNQALSLGGFILLTLFIALYGASDCPEKCICFFNTVDCKNKDLQRIPPNVGSNAKTVTLNSNIFSVTTLEEGNFTGMPNVKTLSLKSCGIQRIKRDTFRDMRSLRELNLQDNMITMIDDYSFRDSDLQTLTLDNNPNIKFTNNAFGNSYIKQLFLRKCNLKTLPNLTPLKGILKHLFLEQNNLVFLPRIPVKDIFDDLTSLGLAKNPIQCTCTNSWLAEARLQAIEPLPAVGEQSSDVKARCHNPLNYRGVTLDALQQSDFRCTRPTLGDVFVDLKEDHVRLQCSAQSEENPVVIWRVRGVTKKTIEGTQTNELIYPRNNLSTESFECLAKNSKDEGLQNVISLLIRVSWPPLKRSIPIILNTSPTRGGSTSIDVINGPEYEVKQGGVKKSVSGSGGSGGSDNIASSELEAESAVNGEVGIHKSSSKNNANEGGGSSDAKGTNFMTDRRFTLLELIGAVIGTFTGTLLFFVLTCQCITWYKKREKKRWGTYGPAYSQTYSTPHSHEYDIPRIDRTSTLPRGTSPLSAAGAPGTAPMEFLDFKTTQRLHYPNNV